MDKINCIIIEDQIPAQRILKEYIARIETLNLLAVHNNAIEAMASLKAYNVDLIFLDLHLPEIDGFAFLSSLSRAPSVIVTTAYSEYALEGFELDVTDYLLKPFSFKRFLSAVAKIEQKKTTPSTGANLHDQPYIFVKIDGELRRLDLKQIKYIRAVENYIQIYTLDDRHMLLGTLSNWLENLLPKGFCQVHKSYVVNLAHIEQLKGDQLYLADSVIPIGRTYRKTLIACLPSI